MLEELLRQLGLGRMKFEESGGAGGGGGGMSSMSKPDVEEEVDDSVSLEEFTERRLAESESDNGEPEEGPDEGPSEEEETGEPDTDEPSEDPDEEDSEKLEPDYEEGEEEGSEDEGPSEEEETSGEEEGPEKGEEQEGDFYDPEKFKEENEINRDVPHTNKFPDRESAEYAAVNKASMIKNALDDLEELDTDRGAIPLPDALQGQLDNLDQLENMEHVANMEDGELNKFLWESDEFRHRVQDKADRVKQKRQSKEVTQEFEQLQKDLYEGVSEVLGGEDQITDDVVKKLDSGKSQGREFLLDKIDDRIESELKEDVEAIEEFIDSDEAASMSNKQFANQLEAKKQALRDKRDSLREQYNDVVDTYEEAFDLAPKVQEAKPKTEAEIVTKAYDALDVWQEDAADFSNLLIDDPGAKRELEAFVKNAMRNREKFNNLQHPSDWNDAEDWWHNEFKPSIRGSRQKEKLEKEKGGKSKSKSKSKKKSDDEIDDPDPDEQEEMRKSRGKDVHSMNESRLDQLERETDAV